MTDLSRSYFALNKLIFSSCKALYKKKKKEESWVHSQDLTQGFPTRSLLDTDIGKGYNVQIETERK